MSMLERPVSHRASVFSPFESLFTGFPFTPTRGNRPNNGFLGMSDPFNTSRQHEDHDYILTFDIPGVKREDISLRAEKEFLTIKTTRNYGQHHEESEISEKLPMQLTNQHNVLANLADGVLTVRIIGLFERDEVAREISISSTSSAQPVEAQKDDYPVNSTPNDEKARHEESVEKNSTESSQE